MVSDSAAKGAAILAGVGSGLYSDLNAACSVSVKPHSNFKPNPIFHEQYKTVYNQYLKLYKALELYW
jgi:sugar (pentulose or hexulose) kinase